jgi:DNA-binding LacI/PurR family transcriptional regulator
MVTLRTDMYVPVMMEIAIAVATTARQYGYDVLLLTGEEGPTAVGRVAASGLADAMIVMDVEPEDERIPLLRASERPSVLIGLPADTAGLACVDLDFTATGALCADHLADLGHRDVVVVGEVPAVYQRHTGFAERTLQGLREQAAERGLRLIDRPCEGTYESTAGTVSRIFEERPGTSALVVQNESAIGPLLSLLRQQGRAVPEDVSVVAICPEQVATQSSPQLTSVAIPAQQMGRHAVELVIAELAGRSADEVRLLAPHLTVRASSGPRP